MALTRQVSSITKRSFARVATKWIRQNLPVETTGGGGFAYICPIPYAPCNPSGAGTQNPPTTWTDNLSLAAQPSYTKQVIFGIAAEAQNSNEIYHTGGQIRWQMNSNEPQFTKMGLFLIRPKRKMADQLVKDRLLKQGSVLNPTLGFAGYLNKGLDYEVHEGTGSGPTTYFGSQINRKYWDVLYSREVAFSHPGGGAMAPNVNPANTNPKNNSVTASGTIKLPAGGMLKNAAVASQLGPTPQAAGWEVEYGDQTNETGCFLVCINNGVSADLQSISLGFMVTDYYKAAV